MALNSAEPEAAIPGPQGNRGRKRFALRWVLRILTAGTLALLISYATLPLWLPTTWLARRLEDQLSGELNRRVRVGAIRAGWGEGVTIENLTVCDPAGGPDDLLARVGRLRCDFTPLRTLRTGKVRQLEVFEPEIWLVFDEKGRLINLADFGRKRWGGLPTLNYHVHGAACHLQGPEVQQTFRIDEVTCQMEPRTGILNLAGQAIVPRSGAKAGEPATARLVLDARIVTPKLKDSEALHGEGHVEWSSLSLVDLPVLLAARLPIEQMEGTTTGRLAINVRPDLAIDYDLSMRFDRVRFVQRGLERPAQVPDAAVVCRGRWDPNTDLLLIRDFDCQTQAIHLCRPAEAETASFVLDPNSPEPLALHLVGGVKDWAALCREFPPVGRWFTLTGLHLEGHTDFALDFTRKLDEDRLQLAVDASATRCDVGDSSPAALSVGAGVAKSLHLNLSYDRQSGQYRESGLFVDVGSFRLVCRGEWQVPTTELADRWTWWTRVLPTIRCELTAETQQLEELARFMPGVCKWSRAAGCTGPLRCRFSALPSTNVSQLGATNTLSARTLADEPPVPPEPDEPAGVGSTAATRVGFSLELPAATELSLGEGLFRKHAGRDLSLSAGADVPHRFSGGLKGLSLDLVCGTAGVHLDGRRAAIDCVASFGAEKSGHAAGRSAGATGAPTTVDVRWQLPLRIDEIEGLTALFPQWLSGEKDSLLPKVNGSADLSLSGRFLESSDEWEAHNELFLQADQLGTRWGRHVEKPGDSPIEWRLCHRSRMLAGHREQSIDSELIQPAGRLDTSFVFSGAETPETADDFELVALQADIKSIDRFVAVVPSLREVLDCLNPSGGITLEMKSLLLDGRLHGTVLLNAGDAGFSIAGPHPLDKPPGIPATVEIEWELDQRAVAAEQQKWQVTRASMQFGSLQVRELSGLVATEWPTWILWPSAWARRVARHEAGGPVFRGAIVRAGGELCADETLSRMLPDLARVRDTMQLEGQCTWTLEAGLNSEELSLAGQVDGKSLAFKLDRARPPVPCVRKPEGLSASVAFDLAARRTAEGAGLDVDARRIDLEVGGNHLTTIGNMRLNGDPSNWDRPEDFTFDSRLELMNPTALNGLLPDYSVESLGGGAFVHLVAAGGGNHVSLGLLTAGFDGFSIAAGTEPICVNGEISLDETRARLDQLQLAWGQSRGSLSGVIRRGPDGCPTEARIGAAITRLNHPELASLLRALVSSRTTSTATRPPAGSAPQTEPAGDPGILRDIVSHLRRLDLDLDVYVDHALLELPLDVEVIADAGVKRATIKNGKVDLTFGAAIDGGAVDGTFTTDLNEARPRTHLLYTADRIQPGPVVERYLALTFPGMQAAGPLTLKDESYQWLFSEPGMLNYEVGEGELIIEGGTVAGRAAPLWMTRIFPGLNLASFDFSYMHSWFKKFDDGRVRHQMIFQGRHYSIYMAGGSNAQGRMQYDVGIDFLANFDSQYWAESGQGRIPLFTKTGQMMPDGTLADEDVVYVPRKFITSLLVGNNPLVTAYHAVRKRVLGER